MSHSSQYSSYNWVMLKTSATRNKTFCTDSFGRVVVRLNFWQHFRRKFAFVETPILGRYRKRDRIFGWYLQNIMKQKHFWTHCILKHIFFFSTKELFSTNFLIKRVRYTTDTQLSSAAPLPSLFHCFNK